MDRGARWATVHGVTESDFHFQSRKISVKFGRHQRLSKKKEWEASVTMEEKYHTWKQECKVIICRVCVLSHFSHVRLFVTL